MQPAAFETVQHKKYRKMKKKYQKKMENYLKELHKSKKVKKHIKRVIFF